MPSYGDLIDHDTLRHDPAFAVLAGKLQARRRKCAPVAPIGDARIACRAMGKSRLNRMELRPTRLTPYHKISYDAAAIEALFAELFVEAHPSASRRLFWISTPPTIHCMVIGRAA